MFLRRPLLRLLCNRGFHSTKSAYIDAKHVEEVRIPVPWGHIAGRWWGPRDTVPVVALHGLIDNGATFDRLAPLLDTPSLLSLDLPGHGYSSHIARGMVFHHLDFVFFMRYLLKNHFKWDQLTLLGHSYGSSIWFLYASLFPNDVQKYIDIDGATYTITGKEPGYRHHVRRVLEKHLSFEEQLNGPPQEYTLPELVEIMWESRKEGNLPVNREACKVLLSRGVIKTETGKYYLSRDLRLNTLAIGAPVLNFLFALSERMKCEVLYIKTSHSVVFAEYIKAYERSLELMRKSCKRLESEVIEGGHHTHLEEPEKMAPIINQFLNS